MKQQNGFIIPLVLMLLSVVIVLATSIYQKGSLFVPFMQVVKEREHAKMLALSGVQVAMSQLASPAKFASGLQKTSPSQADDTKDAIDDKKEPDQKDSSKKQESAEQQSQNLLSQLLPTINQWQEYPIKKDIDGIEGTIKIALSCEEGKIDLNRIYDFARKKFVGEGQPRGDWKKIMEFVCQRIQKQMKISDNLFESFEKFFKQRHSKINDATELLPLNGFKPFARSLFYDPSSQKSKEQQLYLLDIFTAYGSAKLQPWLLSHSVQDILELKSSSKSENQKKQEMIQSLIKKLKPVINVSQEWNNLFQPLYGIEFKRLHKGLEAFFDGSFDPKIFSVVSYGVVGKVTQRIYAILEQVRHVTKDKTWYDVKVRKFYWI